MPSQDRKTFFVSGVCCSTEEAVLRKKLDAAIGASVYSLNPVTCELTVSGHVSDEEVLRHVRSVGFGVQSRDELESGGSFWNRHRDALCTATAAAFTSTGILLETLSIPVYISRGFLLAAILVGGWKIFLKAFKATRVLALDMNVLMSLAVVGALIIGRWTEGAAVIVLFALALALESYSAARTRNSIRALLRLSPEQASVLKDGREELMNAHDVALGDLMIIRPGERIPLDATVVEGRSTIDESPVTGESMPVFKEAGAGVFAGSINQRGSLKVRATKRFEDSTIARIIHLVEEAQHKRAPVQHFVDRFARIYTPAVVVMAAGIAILPPVLLHQPFGEWFYKALVLLVTACPCALVISTPVTIVSALTHAARRGILIKGGKYVEVLSSVRAVAFDKTGTLTLGKTQVTDVVPLNSLSRESILRIVAAIEQRSEHPLASAILAEAQRSGISADELAVELFEALPGYGIKAVIGGTTYFLGNEKLWRERGMSSPLIEHSMEALSHSGKTAIIFGTETEPLGMIAVQDTAREHSKHMVDRLRHAGIMHVAMLSGDHETTVRQFAEEVGIEEYSAGLLPAQKVDAVRTLMQRHKVVAMVGDGINDAPALAASSVGIALGGSGSDAALETADVVLMADDVGKIPTLFTLSRKTMSIITQNISLALSLKVLFLILSVTGTATLWMALLADDGAALAVILNGLRILSHKDGP